MSSDGSSVRAERAGLLVVALLGTALGLQQFGWEVLVPTNIDWLMATDDSATHFLGWHVFRYEPWQFPPGIIRGYIAPIGTSIGLTDSIPLAALPLKLVSPLLAEDFQYLGAWLVSSLTLQAIFGYLLMGTVCRDPWLRGLAALFFVVSPTLIWRQGHIALTSHWIILAALWRYFASAKRFGLRRYQLHWAAIVGASGMINPYISGMVAGIAGASIAREWLVEQRLTPGSVAVLATALLLALFVPWWLLGYFSFESVDHAMTGFGIYSMNLNALLNSMGSSRWLPGLPTWGAGQYEGYAYLGLGILMGLVIAIVTLLVDASHGRLHARPLLACAPLILACIVMLAFAASNRVTWGDAILFEVDLGDGPAARLADVFRTSARFVWPAYYGLFFLALERVIHSLSRRWALVVLACLLTLQTVDLKTLDANAIRQRHYDDYLTDPRWEALLEPFEWIVTFPPYHPTVLHHHDFRRIQHLAGRHHKPVTQGYVARAPVVAIARESATLDGELRRSEPRVDALYLFADRTLQGYARYLADVMRCHEVEQYIACHHRGAASIDEDPIDLRDRYRETGLLDYFLENEDEIVVIVANDEATTALPQDFVAALTERGSRIRELARGGSYIAIFRDGLPIFEEIGNDRALDRHWPAGTSIPHATAALEVGRDLQLRSMGHGFGSQAEVVVDGRQMATNERGLNIVVLNDAFEVLSRGHVDSYETGTLYARELDRASAAEQD